MTVTLPPKLKLHCPPLAVANNSLEVTLASWGAVGLDVDWKITKDGVQVAKGKIAGCEHQLLSSRYCGSGFQVNVRNWRS